MTENGFYCEHCEKIEVHSEGELCAECQAECDEVAREAALDREFDESVALGYGV